MPASNEPPQRANRHVAPQALGGATTRPGPRPHACRGFTLIELVAVIVILG